MDDLDIAAERSALVVDKQTQNIQALARQIPEGAPGECERCGEYSGRLVFGACAPCRDRFKLP